MIKFNALQQQVVQPQPVSVSGYSHEERFHDAEEEMHVLLSEEEEGAHCQQCSGANTSAAKVCPCTCTCIISIAKHDHDIHYQY